MKSGWFLEPLQLPDLRLLTPGRSLAFPLEFHKDTHVRAPPAEMLIESSTASGSKY